MHLWVLTEGSEVADQGTGWIACATGFAVGRASVPAKLEAGTEARPTIQIRGWEGVRGRANRVSRKQ